MVKGMILSAKSKWKKSGKNPLAQESREERGKGTTENV